MKTYNVLWIDDEPEKQDGFEDLALLAGINLINFKTNQAGMDALKKDTAGYDAIVLDAKGFEESEDERASLTGLQKSINFINSLSVKKPYFIYSGHLDKEENSSARELLSKETILIKGKDNERLFELIKNKADQQIDTQIRHENKALFMSLDGYDPESRNTVLQILISIKTGDASLSDHLYFTPIRMILEQMFRKANKIGLLHDACVSVKGNQVNLTDSSLFLSGLDTHHSKVRSSQTHFPKIIAEAVKNILFITGAASHTSEVDVENNMNVQAYRSDLKTPYLLFHLTYMLADVLIWFDKYSAENNDVDANRRYWETIEFDEYGNKWEKGEIIRIADNGWGTVEFDNSSRRASIYRGIVTEKGLVEGDRVQVTSDFPKAKDVEKL